MKNEVVGGVGDGQQTLLPGLSSRCWENLVLAMLGEQFMVGEEICGAVVSIRFQEDILRSDHCVRSCH